MRALPPIELLNHAAEKLGTLCREVVFLGGAVVELLLTEKGGLPPRITKDVDVAIEVSGDFLDIYELDRRLLELGFQNDMAGPTCRYLHGFIVIDVIPVNPAAPGDVNNWYPLAIQTAQSHLLANGIQINVITAACFLGTKLTAFRSPTREHHDDIFLSRDFSDIIRVIDGRPTLATEISKAPEDLRIYLQDQLTRILNETYLEDAIVDYVDPGRESLALDRIRSFLK